MSAVVLKNIKKVFGDSIACADINIRIHKGEFFTFLGPSGCGKTTILRLIAGFITPDNGSVFLDEEDITHLPAEKRNVGMVFQNYALFPFLTVSENIAYGLKIRQKKGSKSRIFNKIERAARVAEYMTMIGLDGYENRTIAELSGGEQQGVALARSLIIEPRVLLLDEPLSNLDARLRDKMRVEIKSLQQRLGITTIFVTHDQTEALTLSDRIAVFDQGRVIQIGTPEDIYDNPDNTFVARFIGDTNLFKAQITAHQAHIGDDVILRLPETRPQHFRQDTQFISIRLQDILLAYSDSGATNTFKGKLTAARVNGLCIDYTIQVNGIFFRAAGLNTRANKPLMQTGTEVFMTIPQNSIRLLAH